MNRLSTLQASRSASPEQPAGRQATRHRLAMKAILPRLRGRLRYTKKKQTASPPIQLSEISTAVSWP
jgi:hypothetical protein